MSFLPFALYHGTSTLFLKSIIEHGLAGRNPIADWNVLECARSIHPLVEKHLAESDEFMVKAGSFKMMVEQMSKAWNFQHGDTYLSPARLTAIGYAINNDYGSELLTYTLYFLKELLGRKIPGVADDLYQQFPDVFRQLDIRPAPLLIRSDSIPFGAVSNEAGDDGLCAIQDVLDCMKDSPRDFEKLCQQSNFRLRQPVPAGNLRLWLIQVTRWDPFFPRYELYSLEPNSMSGGSGRAG